MILGSASPRRAALLGSLGVRFVVRTVAVDETAMAAGASDPRLSVERIAAAKFHAFEARDAGEPTLLTADTMVACEGVVMGKPDGADHLTTMLAMMSGRELTIATAVCVGTLGASPTSAIVTTEVRLRDISENEIASYVASGEGFDKAGGLALQSQARPFIKSVEGCWSNVLGLPLCAVSRLLALDYADGIVPDDLCSTARCGSPDG